MIPKKLQGVLWSRDIANLDLINDKNYIIHQVLAYGTWEYLKWLFKTYKKSDISEIFRKYPSKDYTDKTFNFIKKIVLNLDSKNEKIDERLYVKTFPRIIG